MSYREGSPALPAIDYDSHLDSPVNYLGAGGNSGGELPNDVSEDLLQDQDQGDSFTSESLLLPGYGDRWATPTQQWHRHLPNQNPPVFAASAGISHSSVSFTPSYGYPFRSTAPFPANLPMTLLQANLAASFPANSTPSNVNRLGYSFSADPPTPPFTGPEAYFHGLNMLALSFPDTQANPSIPLSPGVLSQADSIDFTTMINFSPPGMQDHPRTNTPAVEVNCGKDGGHEGDGGNGNNDGRDETEGDGGGNGVDDSKGRLAGGGETDRDAGRGGDVVNADAGEGTDADADGEVDADADGEMDVVTGVEITPGAITEAEYAWAEDAAGFVAPQVESSTTLAAQKGRKRRTPPIAEDIQMPEGKQRRTGDKPQETNEELGDGQVHAADKGKGLQFRVIMDQEDIHDKIVEDDYDYHDDATSFDYSTDTTLQNQVLDIGAKDAVVEFARRHKKKQTIILKPAGHIIEVPFRGLYPIASNTGAGKLSGADDMRRDDWPALLNATQWCRGITRGLVECLPGFILSAPFYLTKRVKSYYMRAHVTHGVTSNVDDFLSQPELTIMRPPQGTVEVPGFFKQSPTPPSSKIHPVLLSPRTATCIPVDPPRSSKKIHRLDQIAMKELQEVVAPPSIPIGSSFYPGTKELPAMPIIEKALNIDNGYRHEVIALTDGLVREGLEKDSRQFGTAGELMKLVGHDGLLTNLHIYRPRARVSADANSPATPFSGCFMHAFMIAIALSGKFNIRHGMFGLNCAGFIRPQANARLIPGVTWANGMVLVESSALKVLGINHNLLYSLEGQLRWQHYFDLYNSAARMYPAAMDAFERVVLDSAKWFELASTRVCQNASAAS